MAAVGRRRKDNPFNLPPRTYFDHGQFFYVHKNTGVWEPLGTDPETARQKGRELGRLASSDDYGTMAYYLRAFIEHCRTRVGLPKQARGISPRTFEDYQNDIQPLTAYFGKMLPAEVQAQHVNSYLELGAQLERATRANREKAALSACFTWLCGSGQGEVTINPCFRVSGVMANRETKRERYVDDDEMRAVLNPSIAPSPMVRALAGLIYRTLQRPSDIQKWNESNIKVRNGVRVLSFTQSKTRKQLDIRITQEVDDLLAMARGNRTIVGMTYIHKGNGKAYAEKSLSTMFRGYCRAAGIKDFSIYDLKGKGATDMYRSGVPLEQIQALCGHNSVTTTEIYIKARLREVVEPNQVKQA